MYRNSFDIPCPSYPTVKSNQANIDLSVNMPPATNPEERMRNHLLERAGTASYEKREEMRQAFGLIDDDEPVTLKDFFTRIKDGKYVIPTDEKELNREFWDTGRLLEEITWRDPARKEDEAGFNAANDLLTKALNDVSDEIIVKAPDQGLESLRAFQVKTFH